MVRQLPLSMDNPFPYHEVFENIVEALQAEDYTLGEQFDILPVPNIVDISYGRDVGYSITRHDLGEEIESISATDIRREHANNS